MIFNQYKKEWRLAYFIHAMLAMAVLAVSSPSFSKDQLSSTSFYNNFKNVQFTDQNNHNFEINSLIGKVTLFSFIYTQCSSACPVQTKSLSEILKSLPKNVQGNVQFVSISLDPRNDTPEKLKSFAKRMNAEASNWAFLTGDPANIERISNALRLFGNPALNKDKVIVRPNDHTTGLWLIDKHGELMMQHRGNPIDGKRIASELSVLAAN